ncbi:MAG: hypothetical protein KAR42_11415 [candidate division Zixibacteria bacterium]|nr:hypothetical protein [candidate division Zixibacteria bacterium]
MGSAATLFWGLLFGSIGTGYLIYGRKQRRVVPLVTGLALIAYPYFVPNLVLMVIIGAVLIAVPYFIKA